MHFKMKLPHPEKIPLSKGNFFTSVYSGLILDWPGMHFKMKLPHPEIVPLSKVDFFTSVCSGVILKWTGVYFKMKLLLCEMVPLSKVFFFHYCVYWSHFKITRGCTSKWIYFILKWCLLVWELSSIVCAVESF